MAASPFLWTLLIITAALTLFNPSTTASSASTPSPSNPSPSPSPPPPPSPSRPPPRSRKSRPSQPPPSHPSPPSPSPPSSLPPSLPYPLPPHPPEEKATGKQMNNTVDALIGSGDFGSWVNIITAANPLAFPLGATFFMPQNDAVSRVPAADPFLLPYHVVPQRLTFADLRLFKTNSRIPTLLPGKYIVVTCNSDSNFTVDDSVITQPDVYVTDTVIVHGVSGILDYTVYGVATVDSKPKPEQPSQPSPALSHPDAAAGVSTTVWKSGASKPCLCFQFPVGLMMACAVLGLRHFFCSLLYSVLRRLRGSMEIFVMTRNGKTISLEVKGSETIANVKVKVRVKEGIQKRDKLIFVLNGEKLQDRYTLGHYNIGNQSTLYLLLESDIVQCGGTTNIAAIVGNSVMLGTDARASSCEHEGFIEDDNATKIFVLRYDMLASMEGSSRHCYDLLNAVQGRISQNVNSDVHDAAEIAKNYIKAWEFDQSRLLEEEAAKFPSSLLIVGFDKQKKPHIFYVSTKDTLHSSTDGHSIVIGSGLDSSRIHMNGYIRKGYTREKEVLTMLKESLSMAALEEPFTGGWLRIYHLRPYGHHEECHRPILHVVTKRLNSCHAIHKLLSQSILTLWFYSYFAYDRGTSEAAPKFMKDMVGYHRRPHVIGLMRTCAIRIMTYNDENAANVMYTVWRSAYDAYMAQNPDLRIFSHLRLDIPQQVRDLPFCFVGNSNFPVAFLKPSAEMLQLLCDV